MNDIRISKTTTGNVGEHYVAAELERRNFTTSVVGNNCKDYNIIAINNETHKDVLIQVKASSNKIDGELIKINLIMITYFMC